MCRCGFFNVCVCVCVCVGIVICGCFGNMCTDIYCVLYCFLYVYLFLLCFSFKFCKLCLCILIVLYILFCKFFCHRANWHCSGTLSELGGCGVRQNTTALCPIY